MARKQILSIIDCLIDRTKTDQVTLRNDAGVALYSISGPLTDDQVYEVLDFVNRSYAKGCEHGVLENQRQMRVALGLME